MQAWYLPDDACIHRLFLEPVQPMKRLLRWFIVVAVMAAVSVAV